MKDFQDVQLSIGDWDALWAIADSFGDEHVQHLAYRVLTYPGFNTWTASAHPNVHHYGKGGLIHHTREVVETCLKMGEYYGGCDRKLLFIAALYHDFGKIWDYEVDNSALQLLDGKTNTLQPMWRSTVAKRRIYHITKSVLEFTKAAEGTNLTDTEKDEIVHAILSHHGRPEWKSPVVPQTKIAWILHLCDSMSARVADCDLPKDHYSK
jgi:3'-5' exoribonuclease